MNCDGRNRCWASVCGRAAEGWGSQSYLVCSTERHGSARVLVGLACKPIVSNHASPSLVQLYPQGNMGVLEHFQNTDPPPPPSPVSLTKTFSVLMSREPLQEGG